MMFHSFLILIIAMLGWIRVGSMPVPSFWSSLTSLAYMSSAGGQHNKFPAQFEYSSQQSSSIFDKSTYMDHVEGRNVRGNVINRAINEIVYDPVPLEDNDLSEHFLSQNEIEARHFERKQRNKERERKYRSRRMNSDTDTDTDSSNDGNRQYPFAVDLESGGGTRSSSSSSSSGWGFMGLTHLIPQVNFRCDPLINFKLKQRLVVLGACVTLGLDYLSDIAQWRSYCAIEDNLLQGRFSLRGSELGWAKSWLLNLGLGEEQTAKLKLRMGLNLKNYKAYAKLRFRTEPINPFDIGAGLSCAGKVPLPVPLLPLLRNIPLRVEYRLRLHGSGVAGRSADSAGDYDDGYVNNNNMEEYGNINGAMNSGGYVGGNSREGVRIRRRRDAEKKVQLSTGIGTLDLSLEQLNFCLEWDEKSPVWGVGLVRSSPLRRGLKSFQSMRRRYGTTTTAAAGGTSAAARASKVGSAGGGAGATAAGRQRDL